jgi:26S proteasome regulatory subunit N13
MAGGAAGSGQSHQEAIAAALLAGLSAANAQVTQRAAPAGPGLHDVLRPEALVPLLSQPGMLERLAPHLPEQHRSREALVELAHSPQFQQQLQVGGQR